jgi:hypothetical protein
MPVPEIPEDADQAEEGAEDADQVEEGAEALAPEPKPAGPISNTELIQTFNEETVKLINNLNLQHLARFALDSFSQRNKLMKPEHANNIKDSNKWRKVLYLIRMDVERVKSDDPLYQDYIRKINDFIQSRKEESKKQQQKQKTPKPFEQSLRDYPESPKTPSKPSKKKPPKPIEEEEFEDASGATGSGLGSGLITCPNNVLADVDRLEILIGGKRAGNNSSEIINEATDICKRLFTGGIMDINVYRSLINEIVDDDHSD